MAVPDEATASRFALESASYLSPPAIAEDNSDYDYDYYDYSALPFGVHSPQRYLTGRRLSLLARRCPEMLPLIELRHRAHRRKRLAGGFFC